MMRPAASLVLAGFVLALCVPMAQAERACVALTDGQVVCGRLLQDNAGGAAPSPRFVTAPARRPGTAAIAPQIGACWTIGAVSQEAMQIAVTVRFEMTRDGVPVPDSLRMIENSGGSDTAVAQAFEAARRAVLRCGGNGYDLPIESFDQWRLVEITFDPDELR